MFFGKVVVLGKHTCLKFEVFTEEWEFLAFFRNVFETFRVSQANDIIKVPNVGNIFKVLVTIDIKLTKAPVRSFFPLDHMATLFVRWTREK